MQVLKIKDCVPIEDLIALGFKLNEEIGYQGSKWYELVYRKEERWIRFNNNIRIIDIDFLVDEDSTHIPAIIYDMFQKNMLETKEVKF